MASNSTSSLSEDNASGTNMSLIPTEYEKQIDTTDWMPAKHKKLQHMKEFHEEYHHVFGERASICTIMKNRITHMNPMPDPVCKEEMQSATHDIDVVIEYITDAKGRKVKKLKPLLIKSEPDREYVHRMHSDDNLPHIPEEDFTQQREITIESYSETISSECSSEDITLATETENTLSSMEEHTEDGTCLKESHATEIETALHQIAINLHSATEACMSLASCIPKLEPYKILQVIAQIPPPPMDIPMPIRKALTVDDEDKVVNHLLHGEYELTNTSWSKLQKKYNSTKGRIYTTLKGKRRPEGSQYQQMKKHVRKLETTTSFTSSEST